MKLICLLTLAFSMSVAAFSQNYVYKGDKQYISTQVWGFKLTNYNWTSNDLEVCVAKTNTGGYLMLSIEVPFEETISGSVFIILSNGKTITLTSRVTSDHVDSKSQVLYAISQVQYQMLQQSDIVKIRISLKNPKGSIGGKAGNYTATNKVNEYSFGDNDNTWKTATEIKELDERED